ncbi:siderophore ABC transporter substrate-binding protein [Brevibacillus fulvus]|uniref:Iron complex transport system substrate-binding protein n=1 Tax=Brevibacillus fulvus TaxID=1125967 RepID=A0A938XZM4_9BACL|nr:siderophore ABC transporter substrate-binding protein [Brevibacillus fulvus]MBM7588837.1 iron complex transport system substrate-binding protein [Brevibacillus fulvus]
MKKKLLSILFTGLLAVFTAACGTNSAAPAPAANATAATAAAQPGEEELTIKHQLGETKVKKNPQKVVVFDFGVLDSLDKLGVEVTGVPQNNIPAYLSKYKDSKYANVGGLKEPDFEKINEIGPDLIIISGRQQDSYEEFSKIAPTLYMAVDTSKYMESFTDNMKTLGQIFGKEAAVDEALAQLNDTIKSVHEKVTATGKNALIILANEGKVSAYGAGSRFGIIHDLLGFVPVDPNIEASTHGQSISFEYIAEKDPDYLFVIDRGAVVTTGNSSSPAKQVIENDLVKQTKAYKDGHIVYLDPNYWYLSGGGLLSVQAMIDEVANSVKE